MRSTVGVLFVAAGVLVGAHGLTHWPVDSPPAVAMTETPVVVLPMLAPQTHRVSRAVEGATPVSPSPLPADDRAVAVRDPGRPRPLEATLAATPHNLTRELQQALWRAHCYGGRINGVWSAATRRAMQAFLARANATLPVDKPDVVLLALLQNDEDTRCGSCPPGQQLGAGGACLPAGMLHEAGMSRVAAPSRAPSAAPFGSAREPAGSVWAPSERAALHPAAPPIAGRMSIGGPRLATTELPHARGFAAAEAQAATVTPEGRLLHHRARRFAVAHRHRRPPRFAYRPARGGGSMVGWLFGGWRF